MPSTTRLWRLPLQLLTLALALSSAVEAIPMRLLPPAVFRQQDDQSQRVLANAPRRRLHGKFLHITDIHLDEFYKAHSSTAEEAACHRDTGPAGPYGAETSDCDTPLSLVDATFDWIAAHVRDDIDFVLWTGDGARHDSDELIPRSHAQVEDANQRLADKFVELFDSPSPAAGGQGLGLRVPVVPTLGNNDILPHNVLSPGPNKWLKKYVDIWGRFIPEEQRHSFEFGGWFYVEVIPNHLAVFSLNSLYFFDRNAGVDDCVGPSEPGFKQLEWLRVQLQFMRERGVKAILMGHVPPARTASKQLWDETCWQKYTLWLRQYRDVVVGAFYGHMNVDHFLLQDTDDLDFALLGAVDEDDADGDGGGDDGGDESDGAAGPEINTRSIMEDEMTVQSTADYLQELRAAWAKLPKPKSLQAGASEEEEEDNDYDNASKRASKGRGKKGPKLSARWAERYQLTLVSPSVVPNYFPTLRVVEYNITGLEDVPVWTEGSSSVPVLPAERFLRLYEGGGGEEAAPTDSESDASSAAKDKKKGKKKKGKKKKGGKKKKDPNLVIPAGPSKSALPGPAYSAQPLALVGYTQYYANLTHINNNIDTAEDDSVVDETRWREGKHSGKSPKQKPAKPRPFTYQVEYSTFTDKIYKLNDLTVCSFLKMAYRMGQTAKGKALETAEGVRGEEVSGMVEDGSGLADNGSTDDSYDLADDGSADDNYDLADDEPDSADDQDSVADAASKKNKKKRKKKKARNRVWLHFLRHAFVSTLEKSKLKKLDS